MSFPCMGIMGQGFLSLSKYALEKNQDLVEAVSSFHKI